MGNRLTEVESPQGFAAESSSAAVILASSYYRYPLSTTQVVSGGVTGAGLGKRLASVHWEVVGQMVAATARGNGPGTASPPTTTASGPAASRVGQDDLQGVDVAVDVVQGEDVHLAHTTATTRLPRSGVARRS